MRRRLTQIASAFYGIVGFVVIAMMLCVLLETFWSPR